MVEVVIFRRQPAGLGSRRPKSVRSLAWGWGKQKGKHNSNRSGSSAGETSKERRTQQKKDGGMEAAIRLKKEK